VTSYKSFSTLYPSRLPPARPIWECNLFHCLSWSIALSRAGGSETLRVTKERRKTLFFQEPAPGRKTLCRSNSAHTFFVFAAISFLFCVELFQFGCTGVAGSASSQTAAASSSPAPASIVSSPSINFGGVAAGSSAVQNLMVTNSGNATLTISQETVRGTGFALVGGSVAISISPGQSHSFQIQFAPQTMESASGSIVLMSNDPASPQTISLSGTGIQAQMAYSPSPVNFGNVNVGGTASQTVTLTDTGNAPLILNSVQVSGSPFSFAAFALPATITPGQSLGFSLQFAPTAGGTFSGTATIASNAGNVSINLGGTAGAAPSIAVPPTNATGAVGQTATFTVVATGTAPFSYQWMKNGTAIGGAISASYTTPPTTTSDNGAQFSVVVSNAAGSTPSATATLTVASPLGQLTPSTSTLDFGNVTLGSTGTLSVTLANTGSSNVTISADIISGSGFTSSGVAAGLVLAPGQSVAMSVTFAPTTPGYATGSITLTSDASNSPDNVTLSGTGVQPVSHSVTLDWAPSSSTVAGYNVYRSTQSGGPYTQINSSLVTTPQFTDSSVQSGQTYFYVVRAVDPSNQESGNSNEVAVSIPAQQ